MEGSGFREQKWWWLVLAAILSCQAWLILGQFDASHRLDRLLNNAPVVSGQHPLHQYHGRLGALTWIERQTSSCYDPAFQAGYPKTPVFDAGSRLAELFLLIGDEPICSYKLGLASMSLMIPFLFALIARGIRLSTGIACLAAFLGGLLWWTPSVQQLVHQGEMDAMIGSLMIFTHVAWWTRFAEDPWIDSWMVLFLSAVIGWFTQPLLMILFFPVMLSYYFWIAHKQGIAWHLSIIAITILALLVNAPWLSDWIRYALPLLSGSESSTTQMIPSDQILYQIVQFLPHHPLEIGIDCLGIVGFCILFQKSSIMVVMSLLGMAIFAALGIGGHCWQPLEEMGSEKYLPIANWMMVCPAAYLLGSLAIRMGRSLGSPFWGTTWLMVAIAAFLWFIQWPEQISKMPVLPIGFTTDQEDIINHLKLPEQPTDINSLGHGRILWEDRSNRTAWTALLPYLTHRDYIGGLDPKGRLEHTAARLVDGKLRGKPMRDWGDEELKQFCQNYNITWVVAWSQESIDRWTRFPMARKVQEIHDVQLGVLFELERPASLFLKGTGRVVQLDWQRIALADVFPSESGEVVLSLHYQNNWRIAPPYVQMEQAITDPMDPVRMIRLKLPGPVARLTLVWENR